MTLSSAIRSATSALSGNAKHASILSRNIAGVGDPNYVKRDAVITTQLYGTIKVDTQRYVQRALYDSSIFATAEAENANVVKNGIDKLAFSIGIDDFSHSPASLLAGLRDSIDLAAAAPSNIGAASTLVENGRIFASNLNQRYTEVLSMRAAADKEIDSSVKSINSLLGQLETINDRIIQDTHIGRDVFDSLDVRDQIIDKLSSELSLKILPRDNNDIVVMTGNGLILFEKRAREVSFVATPSYGAGTIGNSLYIDGVPASGDEPWLPVTTGRLGGNFKMRDEILVNQQNQLDEIARAAIELFAEEDQTGGVKPKLSGLFAWAGSPAVPPTGVLAPGIAGSIRVNTAVDPQAGGNPYLIRDGGINGDPDYISNISGGTGFSDRLFALSASFETQVLFDPQAGLPPTQSLSGFAASSLDWLNSTRQSAHNEAGYRSELSLQYTSAYQNASGTNLDDEMSKLLEVERAYQASAKLLATIDEMFSTLLNAVRV